MDLNKQREWIKQRQQRIKNIDRSKCKEIWVHKKDGQAMSALINGDLGWLMYLRYDGDTGFSSRNPAYRGPKDAARNYFLNNGQCDEYPLSYALPTADVRRALKEFKANGKPPTWVTWHNDSEDGTMISE